MTQNAEPNPPFDGAAAQADLDEAQQHLERAGEILRQALEEDARLAAQLGGEQQ